MKEGAPLDLIVLDGEKNIVASPDTHSIRIKKLVPRNSQSKVEPWKAIREFQAPNQLSSWVDFVQLEIVPALDVEVIPISKTHPERGDKLHPAGFPYNGDSISTACLD